jgi:GNAT superfamily N-acetyltransferase
MTLADLDEVVDLHIICFPGDFISMLGRPFLYEFYRKAMAEIALVALLDGRVAGAQLTFMRASTTYLRMLLTGGVKFAKAAVPTAAQGPRQAAVVALALVKPFQAWRPKGEATAMYTSVHPNYRGKGIANLLLKRMLAEAELAGVSSIHGENDDDPILNSLYESVCFVKGKTRQTVDGRRRVEMSVRVRRATAMLATDPDFRAAAGEAAWSRSLAY